MIAPADVPRQEWRYAVSRVADRYTPIEISTVEARPKLHYHRSGVASVTLTGQELERRSMRLPPVGSVGSAQILSVVAIRPWELPLKEFRKGDIGIIHDRWPGDVTYLFQIIRCREPLPATVGEEAALAPLRLLQLDDSRFVVDMSAYLPKTLLVGLTAYHDAPSDFLVPSITVAALPWSPDRSAADKEGVLALWSSGLRNPLIAHARPQDVLTEPDIRARVTNDTYRVESIREAAARLYGRHDA